MLDSTEVKYERQFSRDGMWWRCGSGATLEKCHEIWWVSCRVGQFRLDNEADARTVCDLLNGVRGARGAARVKLVKKFTHREAGLLSEWIMARFTVLRGNL